MLTLQSSKSRIVCLLIVKVKHDSQGDDILLTSQGVSFTEVLEGLKYVQVQTNCQYSVAQMCTREEYSPAFK